MIAPLRRRHRRTFLFLSATLPVLYLTALALRPAPPAQAALPAELTAGRTPIAQQPSAPDPLLYWTATTPDLGATLPADARLLGSLRSGELLGRSTNNEQPRDGTLLVYSLVDQRITAILPADAIEGGSR